MSEQELRDDLSLLYRELERAKDSESRAYLKAEIKETEHKLRNLEAEEAYGIGRCKRS